MLLCHHRDVLSTRKSIKNGNLIQTRTHSLICQVSSVRRFMSLNYKSREMIYISFIVKGETIYSFKIYLLFFHWIKIKFPQGGSNCVAKLMDKLIPGYILFLLPVFKFDTKQCQFLTLTKRTDRKSGINQLMKVKKVTKRVQLEPFLHVFVVFSCIYSFCMITRRWIMRERDENISVYFVFINLFY